jgi:hypothetical protein
MKNNLYHKGFIVPVLLGVIALLIIGGGVYLYKNKKVEAPIVANESENVGLDNQQEVAFVAGEKILGNKEDLVSFSVKAGDTVSGLLKLSGIIKNGYFFEGNIEIHLLDSNQKILRSGNGMSTTEWTTAGPVSFNSTIDSLGISGPGFIMIRQDDPSGGEGGPAKKILIPVVFNNLKQDTMSIKLYFSNRIYNPEMLDCRLVYPVTRIIPKTQAVAEASLNELIKGPTAEEIKLGYVGVIPEGTKVNSIKIVDGVLSVDFNKNIENNFASCSGTTRMTAIGNTLKQFSTIKSIKYSVAGNSNPNEILQP